MKLEAQSNALRDMRLVRTCPSVKILANGGRNVEQHLAGCPACRAKLANADLAARAGKLLAGLASVKTEKTVPAPGDLRYVRPASQPENWWDAEGTYHNPPLVLVLGEPDADGFVQVAQVFDNHDLQDKGDVALEDGKWGYAEAWNIYGLPASALQGTALHRLDSVVVEDVLFESEGVFPPLGNKSPLFHFRQRELATGSFFRLPLNLAHAQKQEASQAENAKTGGQKARIIRFDRSLSAKMASGQKGLVAPASLASLSLAAADDCDQDSSADEHARIIVRAVWNHNDGSQKQENIPASVNVTRIAETGTTVFDIHCRFAAVLPVLSYSFACNGQAPEEDPLAMWSGPDGQALEITASFASPECKAADIVLEVCFSEQESQQDS